MVSVTGFYTEDEPDKWTDNALTILPRKNIKLRRFTLAIYEGVSCTLFLPTKSVEWENTYN